MQWSPTRERLAHPGTNVNINFRVVYRHDPIDRTTQPDHYLLRHSREGGGLVGSVPTLH